MKRENWNRDWYFTKGQGGLMQDGRRVQLPHDYMIESDVEESAPAAAAMGYFTGTVGTYTKYFHVPEEWQGERVWLHFDGVMMNASVSVNGSLVKRHHYGYTPFSVDITDALYFGGDNRVTVTVNPSMQPNSRWYTGAGIYRRVELSHVKPLHVEPDGIFAYTKRIDYGTGAEAGNSTGTGAEAGEPAGDRGKQGRPDRAESAGVMVEVTLRNRLARDHQVRVRAALIEEGRKEGDGRAVCLADGRAAGPEERRTGGTAVDSQRAHGGKDGGTTVMARDTVLLVKAGSTAVARIPMTVPRPLTWDAEHPNLYRVRAQVEDMGAFGVALDREAALEGICDEAETLFGIRTVTADAVHGLQVNGRTVKLKGGCIHHDNGLLGAVSLRDGEYRKLGLLKEAGFNAVRLAHNPGSRELLEACDRLGLYVFDEAFDAWGHSKQPGDYSQFFARDWKEDMESFILRDRNHPSILIWSTGNEVEERGGMGNGYALAEELAAYVRSLDSTRLVANGLCSMWSGLDDASVLEQMAAKRQGNAQNEDSGEMDGAWEDRTESFCNCLDVVGYNYMDSHYEYAGQRYPERVILGTESFPNQFDKVWELVERLPYVIGDFTWTAVDYIGEAGIGKSKFFEQGDPELAKGPWAISSHASEYPWRLANDADITIGGTLTPQGVYRKIVWGSSQTGLYVQHPKYHGLEELVSNWGWNQMTDCWNYEGYAGKPVKAYVYSAAKEVELFLNGKSLGRAAAGKENRFCAVFETVYEPGVLRAVSLDGDREVSGAEIATAGEPASIRLTADKTRLKADGEGLSYVAVEILDKDGNVVKDGEIQLEAFLEATRAQYHSLSPVRKILGKEGMKEMMAGFGAEAEKEAPDASACLAGFGSDNPVTEDNYTAGKCRSYQGRALAVVRAGQIAGKALLRVAAPGLGEASLEIAVEA